VDQKTAALETIGPENSRRKSRLPDAINCSTEKNFTQIPNQLLRDPNLSFKAKGILCLLLSNREGWESYIETIKHMGADGTTAISTALHELEESGYLVRVSYRDKVTKRRAGSFWAYTDAPHQFDMGKQLEKLSEMNFEITPESRKPNAALKKATTRLSTYRKSKYRKSTTNNTKNKNIKMKEEENCNSSSKPFKSLENIVTPDELQNTISPDRILYLWNYYFEGTPIKPILKLTADRITKLNERIKELPKEKDWSLFFRKIKDTPFLMGENDRGTTASFEWLFDEDKFTKIRENFYDEHAKKSESKVTQEEEPTHERWAPNIGEYGRKL
jgi:hypothetical protein